VTQDLMTSTFGISLGTRVRMHVCTDPWRRDCVGWLAGRIQPRVAAYKGWLEMCMVHCECIFFPVSALVLTSSLAYHNLVVSICNLTRLSLREVKG
jgi:hypothetical protein